MSEHADRARMQIERISRRRQATESSSSIIPGTITALRMAADEIDRLEAENATLRDEVVRAHLGRIEAQNPGIDLGIVLRDLRARWLP